jgi:hypothetical protein
MADQEEPQLAQPTPAHDPSQKTKDLSYHASKYGKAYSQLVALAHANKLTVDRASEFLVQSPHLRDHMLEFLHKEKGNSFVQKVMHAMPHAKKEAAVNLDEKQLNPDHPGKTRSGADDHNRVAVGKTKSKDHPEYSLGKLATACSIYQNDGKPYPIGQAKITPAQDIQLNAGAQKKLKLADQNGVETECVMAFYIDSVTEQHVTGWIPITALDDTGKHLAAVDKTVAKKAHTKVEHAHLHFTGKVHTVTPVGAPAAFANLMTNSNQDPAKGANMPDHYYARPGNVVNLLNNAPNSGSGKFGVAIDVLVAGTKFQEATPRLSEHTQLWEAKSSKLTNQQITFVFGKATVDGQPGESYGWINIACLA